MTQREQRLTDLAIELLPAFLFLHRDRLKGRKGCCMATHDLTRNTEPDIEASLEPLGEVPFDKRAEKRMFATDKVRRIYQYVGHLTSFESENEAEEKYGGGIRINHELIIAVSGFPAYLDQEFCIWLGLLSGEMSFDQAMFIRQRTQKKYPTDFFLGY